jgi:hypothetical protein
MCGTFEMRMEGACLYICIGFEFSQVCLERAVSGINRPELFQPVLAFAATFSP